jgi:ATP-binding cassette, subfamily F, member 3
MPKGTRIGQVAQEAPGTDEPLIDIVLAADSERLRLMQEAETATDAHRIAEIQTRLPTSTPIRPRRARRHDPAGLGFDHEAQKRPASSFSGGWRMRVALAAVLFAEPDLLLLDEPTNYLDLEGTMWLESYLAKYPHTVLLISHDRDLLNRPSIPSCIWKKKLTFWRGGYDQFERQRAEKMELCRRAPPSRTPSASTCRPSSTASATRRRRPARRSRGSRRWRRWRPIAAILDEHVHPFSFPEPVKSRSPRPSSRSTGPRSATSRASRS